MAVYHFNAKIIGRSKGSRAIAAAAYRSASRLYDERFNRTDDFTHKPNVIHSQLMAPSQAASQTWPDRSRLWNEVERRESRPDARLAREIVVAIPPELNRAQGIVLVQDFVQKAFVDRGMVADLNIHWDTKPGGVSNPHAHVMLTLREIVQQGQGLSQFGLKVREWDRRDVLLQWREAWADHVNATLARLQIDARIDHRSNKERGIELEPRAHLGAAAAGLESRGFRSQRAQAHRDTARRNGARLIADPGLGLAALTHQYATFTRDNLSHFAHYHSDSKTQFKAVLSALLTAPELVVLGPDQRGAERYTSVQMVRVEQALERSALAMAQSQYHGVAPAFVESALEQARRHGFVLSTQQGEALGHVLAPSGLSAIIGYAGSGKSAVLGVAHQAWAAQGFDVKGATLSGLAAESLQRGAGISSRTLASLEQAWSQDRDLLTARDVLVIDEAGLVGSRQLQNIITQAQRAGAKVVLVGDAEQLQAIEAGAAFRMIVERHGAAEVTQVRRQRLGWQAKATEALALGRVDQALTAYISAGCVVAHGDARQAQEALVAGWAKTRGLHADQTHLILAYSRAEAQDLNILARQALRREGLLGPDHFMQTEGGERHFAVNDQIIFQRNDRVLGVSNGTSGIIEEIDGATLGVRLAGGRKIKVALESYAQLDHGYAMTVHRAQGQTVDHVHVMASPLIDRHSAYVALSRHRDAVTLHYDRQLFASPKVLSQVFGRDRSKDMALDYVDVFATRRQLPARSRPQRRGALEAAQQSWTGSEAANPSDLDTIRALERYAAAVIDIQRARREGRPVTDGQMRRFDRATRTIGDLWPGATADLARMLQQKPGLLGQIALGRAQQAAAALSSQRLEATLAAERPDRTSHRPGRAR